MASTALSVRYGCFSWQEQHFEHVLIFFRGRSRKLRYFIADLKFHDH